MQFACFTNALSRLAGVLALAGATLGLTHCGNKADVTDGGTGGAGNGSGGDGGASTGGFSIGSGGDGNGSGGSGFVDCDTQADCPDGALCKYEVCIPDLGSCTSNADCPGDSYCDADDLCVPYGVPPDKVNDPECQRGQLPDGVNPVEQCAWESSDNFRNIYTTPIVADLNLDRDPDRLQPSILLTTWREFDGGERLGVLRVFDGRTCTEQLSIGSTSTTAATAETDAVRPGYGAQLAVADLDGDLASGGHPEIIGLHRLPGTIGNPRMPQTAIAWEVKFDSEDEPYLDVRWYGRICAGTFGRAEDELIGFGSGQNEYGPGIWDLDDDGVPEIVVDKLVFDNEGCLQNDPATSTGADCRDEDGYLCIGGSDYYTHYLPEGNGNSKGVLSTVADVDLDGAPDLVRFDGVYGWQGDRWEKKSYWTQSDAQWIKPGHVAIADVGHYSALTGHPASDPLPEIIVVSAENNSWNSASTGTVRIMTLTGAPVMGPVELHRPPGDDGGHGGPPTASDFDGDGQVEVGVAANAFYTVYDPDCVSGGASERAGGTCVRSDATLPDYILWGQPSQDRSSSQTGSSIFDFDGDGRAEVVYRDECFLRVYDGATGAVLFSAAASNGTGMEYPVIADVDGDFATEIVVPRASHGNGCAEYDPLFFPEDEQKRVASDPGRTGFVVLRDPQDLWANSRPIWNQHAYSITHITDDGRVPRSSEMQRNWEVEGLNNFRQNTQGDFDILSLADLTVVLDDLEALCAGTSGQIDLKARVCNRGTAPVQDGAKVAFTSRPKNDPTATPSALCTTNTPKLLGVGECVSVSCMANVPQNHDVYVSVDPDDEIPDCTPGNNDGAGSVALCPVVR